MKKFLAIDIETTGLTWKDDVLTVGAAWNAPTGIESKAWSLGMSDLFVRPYSVPEFVNELSSLCAKADVVVMHNTVFDLSYLVGNGYMRVDDVRGKIFDTLLAARMTGPRTSLSLENLCRSYGIGDAQWGNFKSKRKKLSSIDVESVLSYNRMDAENTLRLAQELWQESVNIYGETFTLHESDFCRLMAEVRIRGKRMNMDSTISHWRNLTQERRAYLQGFLWNNQIQGPNDRTGLIKYLRSKNYQDRHFVFTDKGNESFDEKSLLKMAESALGEVREVLEAILHVRHIEKILSTYLVPFIEEHADENDTVHPSYTVGGTVTYRLSSQNPSAHTIPRELTGTLWESYISADYSQAELRLSTAYARETTLARAFAENADIHTETAQLIFGKTDPETRKVAKNVNFCVLYGGGARTLEERYNVPYEEGVKMIKKHRQVYPQLHKFTRLAKETWEKKGYIRLVTGKRIWATDDDLRRGYKAFNNLIQGGVGELVKEAMLELDKRGARIIGQVHDSIEFEQGSVDPEDIRDVMENILPQEFTNRTNPPIRMKVDIETKGTPCQSKSSPINEMALAAATI